MPVIQQLSYHYLDFNLAAQFNDEGGKPIKQLLEVRANLNA